MKETKFRAWHPVVLSYYYSDDYCNLADFFEQIVRLGYDDIEMVLEEYIGQKDKHGTEMYDGDLLTSGGSLILEIGWNDGGYWEVSGIPWYRLGLEVEVIGNIYENPELLN